MSLSKVLVISGHKVISSLACAVYIQKVYYPLKAIFFFFFVFSRAMPAAYGGSRARGLIRAVASTLHHSHSNAGSKLHLQPTPQFTVMPDP